MEWKPIDTAPFDRDVEIAIIDGKGVRALARPHRLTNRDGSTPKISNVFTGPVLHVDGSLVAHSQIRWHIPARAY